MFKQILYTQWKWGGIIAVIGAVTGFAIPVASVQNFTGAPGLYEASQLVNSVQGWGYLYPLLAIFVGFGIALASWGPDQQGRHVYALSLPVPRPYYVLFRFGAGALLLVPAALGVLVGGLVATASVTIPLGLHPYPFAIAARFGLATLLLYALLFSVAAGTRRTAWVIVGGITGLFVIQTLIHLVAPSVNVMDVVLRSIVTWPGPFEVLMSAWMLINV